MAPVNQADRVSHLQSFILGCIPIEYEVMNIPITTVMITQVPIMVS